MSEIVTETHDYVELESYRGGETVSICFQGQFDFRFRLDRANALRLRDRLNEVLNND